MCLRKDDTPLCNDTPDEEEEGSVACTAGGACCLYLAQIDVQRYAAYRIKACDEDNGSHCNTSKDVAAAEPECSGGVVVAVSSSRATGTGTALESR